MLTALATLALRAQIVLLSPSDQNPLVSIHPRFQWSTADTTSTFILEIYTDGMGINLQSRDSIEGVNSAFTIRNRLDYNTKYWWRMNYIRSDSQNIWSPLFSFTTQEFKPVMTFPVDGALKVSVKPAYHWDLVDGATRYILEVYNDSLGLNLRSRDSLQSTVIEFVEPFTLNYSTAYWWRMTYIKNDTQYLWTHLHKFTTHGPPPPVPTLLAPASASINSGLRPTFEWTPTATSVDYKIQVSTFMNFADTIYSETVLNTSYSVSTNLEPNTVYYWRVSARNTEATSDFSDFWNFTTLATGITSPVNNELKLSAYPNPSNGLYNLNFTAEGNQTQIAVFDGQGKKVLEQNLTHDAGSQNTTLNLRDRKSVV